MADPSQNPKNEIGSTSGMKSAPWSLFSTAPASGWVVDPLEANPDLRFPYSVAVFDEMRRIDAQVGANLRAMYQPILSARWDLVGASDVRPEVAEFVRSEIGLVEANDARRRRRRHGIVFQDHLREALTCLPFGFSVFEQVYLYDEADGRLHLRKLAHRPASTIRQIRVGQDGGLEGIVQAPREPGTFNVPKFREVFIPVEHLLFYTLDKEGADWTGVSVLRTAYRNYLIKERLERLAAQIVERNGMGIPVGTVGDNASEEARHQLNQAVQDLRAGARAGIVIPENTSIEIKGVSGSTADALPLIEHHDQQISKSMHAMFLDLGHDAGARSLGDTFTDVFLGSCQAIADKVAEDFTEHVIRDLVERNFGPDEPYPMLVAGDLKANRVLDPATLKTLIDAKVITPTEEDEKFYRAHTGLPEFDPAQAREVEPAPAPAPAVVPVIEGEVVEAAEHSPHMDRMEALTERWEALKNSPKEEH